MQALAGLLKAKRVRPSPLFSFSNTASLDAGASIVMDLETGVGEFTSVADFNEYGRYAFFANVSVINNNTDNMVRFEPNSAPGHGVDVMNRGAQDLSDVQLKRWKVTNKGTTAISAGQITVTVWNE